MIDYGLMPLVVYAAVEPPKHSKYLALTRAFLFRSNRKSHIAFYGGAGIRINEQQVFSYIPNGLLMLKR